MIHWEADVECTSCNGTGLYKGMAEGLGAAVVCSSCKGTGCKHVEYEFKEFKTRKLRDDITRVYKTAGGYGIKADDHVMEDGRIIHFSQAGATYQDWLKGRSLAPLKDLHCPLMHYQQGTTEGEWLKDYGPCLDKLHLGGSISSCSKIHREECWKFTQSLPEKFK